VELLELGAALTLVTSVVSGLAYVIEYSRRANRAAA